MPPALYVQRHLSGSTCLLGHFYSMKGRKAMSVKNSAIRIGLMKAYDYIEKDPEQNIPRMMSFLDAVVPDSAPEPQRRAIREVIGDKDSNWYRLFLSLFTDIDAGVRRRIFENFVVNSAVVGWETGEECREKYGCNIPWAILMDPTSACNLHCTGCWAAEYGNKLNLTYEEMEDIVNQANEMGTYMFLFTGGEPMVRKKDIIRLCEAHNDCVFSAFTNGTLIDEKFADEMLRVKNFVPAISVEGFEEATDDRRGHGTYAAVVRAMDILRRRKLPFGISCCYTSRNYNVIGSEEYFDDMIAKGAKFAWLFTYMPVGKNAVPELMVTAEQRAYMYRKVREFRHTKPLFTMDFWNDGEYVGGCIAGGRSYCHINAAGDIEPCAFIHYSDSNIREKTLLEAYKSPLFMAYHRGQPFNCNHLRPCPLLDNPGALAGMVHESGAKSTDVEAPEDVDDLTAKCAEKAEMWAVKAGELWSESHP